RELAARDRAVQHPGKLHIVDEGAAAADETRVFFPAGRSIGAAMRVPGGHLVSSAGPGSRPAAAGPGSRPAVGPGSRPAVGPGSRPAVGPGSRPAASCLLVHCTARTMFS